MQDITFEQIKEATEYIKNKIEFIPDIAMVLGSGLGNIVEGMENKIEIHYSEIPNFPISTVKGHGGKLVAGKFKNKKIIAMQGRIHYYEGYTMQQVTFPIRVFKLLGINNIITLSAVGAINENYNVGDIVIIGDYIKLFDESPLRGANLEEFGTRFPNVTGNNSLIPIIENSFINNNINIKKAVYAFMSGPQYETKAEVKMLRILGADVVGMSTVPEIIVAKHSNMEICSLGCVTNAVSDGAKLSHEDVLKASEVAKEKIYSILSEFIENI